MGKVVYTSKSSIERKRGPLRIAHLPGEARPVVYSVHGAIAEHYKVKQCKDQDAAEERMEQAEDRSSWKSPAKAARTR